MSTHRSPLDRRPLYVTFIVAALCGAGILAFGTGAQTPPPLFHTTTQADAAPVGSAVRPSPIPLPASSTSARAAVTPLAAPSSSSSTAQPTPFASSYRPVLTAHSAAAGVTTPETTTPTEAVKSPGSPLASSVKRRSPTTVTSHPGRPATAPSSHPISLPSTHPASTAPGSGTAAGAHNGSHNDARPQLPWWWYLTPHQPTVPHLPSRPTTPRLPVATHTFSSPATGSTITRHGKY